MKFEEEWNWLNSYQMDAVTEESPACVVNANVGSGKTTVLIAKILYLHYEKKIPLEEMVVLTFTNKAATEIIERLKKKEPDLMEEQVAFFGTFHSVAMRMLKKELPEEGHWNRNFEIIDPDEECELAVRLIAEHGLKVKYKNRLKKRLEQEYPDYRKGKSMSRYKDDLFLLYPVLQEEKKRQNKMSFLDLLEQCIICLKTGKTSFPKWIVVDEVQDSDATQMELLEALKGPDTKLFAVGDPNQVIYSFRGTTQNMFFLLKNRFQAKELSLPVNYRSNASILEAANRFLQFGGRIQGNNETGEKIRIRNHYDPFQEAVYLADKIEKLHREGTGYREIAIFYRLQRQAEVLEKVFDEQKIPYMTSVKKSWKDIPVLEWFVNVLRFSILPEDEHTGIWVLTQKRYGETFSKKKAEEIVKNRNTEKPDLYRGMLEFKERCGGQEVQTADHMEEYFGLKEALHPTASSYPEDIAHVKALLNQLYEYKKEKNLSLLDAIREFVNGITLGSIEYIPEMDEVLKKEGQNDKVSLMTLHASKGLEFDTVFIIGANPGLLPIRCSSFDQEEEERRLFFVGITRARNHLEISYYTNPGEPGVIGNYCNYLRMIPEDLLEWDELRSESDRRANLKELARQAKEEIRKAEEKKPDQTQKAVHPKYGTGVVLSEDDMMIEVEFPNYGKKQFIKAFQEVKRI